MRDYPHRPLPFSEVALTDGFWRARQETNRRVTLRVNLDKCAETGRIDNFRKAAGELPGAHEGIQFNDSDVFKVIEGVALDLQLRPDPALQAEVETIISHVAAAQEPDGYLYTARTIDPAHPHEHAGLERWSWLAVNHELYNLGHMYEAAVAWTGATGSESLLDVARRNFELIDATFGPDALREVPGHQEIELGLVKLFRLTGEQRFLDQARFFLDERGHANGRELQTNYGIPGYMQDHLPLREQREAVGHAVRATYMYAAMTDLAALDGDEEMAEASRALWRNVSGRKLALTGGIGARHHGEAFGDDYELPNQSAYNETCAAIGNIFWNQRLFQLDGDARYLDVLERTLYNGFLAGIDLAGDRFFYVNPLAADGVTDFNRDDSLERQPWFSCSCCPTNVIRLLPTLGGMVYAQRDDQLYVNLFISNAARATIAGVPLDLQLDTSWPWAGNLRLRLNPERPLRFTLKLRVPGPLLGQPVPGDLYRYLDERPACLQLRVNGAAQAADVQDGYLSLTRDWQPGDAVELDIELPVRRVVAHPEVADLAGRVALERGPLVYAAEGIDNDGRALDLVLPDDLELRPEARPELTGGVTLLRGAGFSVIPYYAWGHRGVGEMNVWFERAAAQNGLLTP
ncbi:MAG: glycoside hydrolase family 127 protein [Anaerolineaceae bacterium]|nr:glycoside hydrolase family 127 protein [Anaerolineaceae bacterium]MDE0327908.1 glycoside hydrolase family 127 protein [Anaerolineaceae bacterium]